MVCLGHIFHIVGLYAGDLTVKGGPDCVLKGCPVFPSRDVPGESMCVLSGVSGSATDWL